MKSNCVHNTSCIFCNAIIVLLLRILFASDKVSDTTKLLSIKCIDQHVSLWFISKMMLGNSVYALLMLRMANDVDENPGPTVNDIIDPNLMMSFVPLDCLYFKRKPSQKMDRATFSIQWKSSLKINAT